MSTQSKEKREKWSRHIQEWKNSGLTQQAYCNKHGLKSYDFSYWKLKPAKSVENQAAKSHVATQERSFVPVSIDPVSTPGGLVLHLPCGINLSGITDDNAPVVIHLVEGLK
jgi:hypothetical protein